MTTYFFYKLTINSVSYIGSTKNIKNRISSHKSRCYDEKDKRYNTKLYKYIRCNEGFNNVKIQIIDVIDNIDRTIAHKFEQNYIKYFKSELNSIKSYRSQEEIEKYRREYRENNIEEIKKRGKKYRDKHKEYYKEYSIIYRKKNKDELNQKKKQYYEKNKEKMKEKVKCNYCNKEMNKSSLSRHKKNCKKNHHK